ncbi:MAG: DUF2914 domain-containing protein [Candidatus Eisenbacteria bacterium]
MLTPPARTTLFTTAASCLAAVLLLAGSVQAQEADPDAAGRAAESSADTTASDALESAPDDPGAPAADDVDEAAMASPATGPETRSDLSVLRAYICRGIEQSEPTEAGKSFIPAADGQLHLCCFSEIGGPARRDTVVHVWYWGEREMARVRLGVTGPRWRTWSTKRVLDEWRGEWRVDITDDSGVLLSRLPFSVE